jgi:hypothetical protein
MMVRIERLFDAASVEADSLSTNTDKSLQSILDRRFADLLKTLNANATGILFLQILCNQFLIVYISLK